VLPDRLDLRRCKAVFISTAPEISLCKVCADA
jgi:hypothetical protein